jgi:hypothetical protein
VADEGKDETVLGNLPRSRPGRRSEKRSTGGAKKRQPAAGATARRGSTSARGAATRSKAGSAERAGARKQPPAPQPTAPSRGPDPVGDALRIAGKVAELGFKTAGGILRRLPGR